ncbi:hypothetical protein [Ferrimonas kyonanensis]|uniref:hypothetical protein n=1 Tax=Ferrimonas kyonanensis TaxID=364763 RepID=UPI0012EC6497|nr:hypothetical protein [Ferrimonas kyonanensis]
MDWDEPLFLGGFGFHGNAGYIISYELGKEGVIANRFVVVDFVNRPNCKLHL